MQITSQKQREQAIRKRQETAWKSPKTLPVGNSVVLIDGAVGGEIYERVENDLKHLWANAAFFGNGPTIAKQVHTEFFGMGCQVATVNSYMACKTRLEDCKIKELPSQICNMALEAARQASQKSGSGIIAGSLGPLFNSYRPDQDSSKTFNEQVELYMEYMNDLMDSDVLLFETISSLFHADTIIEAVRRVQPAKPVWISVTVDDHDGRRLRSGEPVSDLKAISETGLIEALLVNCSKAESTSEALEVIKNFKIPFGGYCNGTDDTKKFAETKDFAEFKEREDLNPEKYANFVIDWINKGAKVVGGCCRIGPKYIAEAKKRIDSEGIKLHRFE